MLARIYKCAGNPVLFTNMRPYESYLDTITPEIQTPRSVGQYHHGSARWMTDHEKDKVFDSFTLDPRDQSVFQLLETDEGLEFLKQKKPVNKKSSPKQDLTKNYRYQVEQNSSFWL